MNYISQDLRSLLNKIASYPASTYSKNLEKHDVYLPIVLERKVGYLRKRDIIKYIKSLHPNDSEEVRKEKFLTLAQKNTMKPGKFLTKCGISTTEVERFISFFEPPRVIEIPSKLIDWAYSSANNVPGSGSLSSSCMRHEKLQKIFRIYRENARMIGIYVPTERKISARALVWDAILNDKPVTFMDRVYGNPKEVEHLVSYAKKQGWAYKDKQTYSEFSVIYKGASIDSAFLSLNLKTPIYTTERLPYMDTFCCITESSSSSEPLGKLVTKLGAYGNTPESSQLRSTTGNLFSSDLLISYSAITGKIVKNFKQGTKKCPICGEEYRTNYKDQYHHICVPFLVYQKSENLFAIASSLLEKEKLEVKNER